MADEKRNLLGPYIPDGGFIREVVQQVKLAYRLMLDPRVHPLVKLIPLAALIYVISPIDLIPDMVPVLGQLDDVAIVLMGLRFFFEFAPPPVVHEHLQQLAADARWTPPPAPKDGEVVEGTFHVKDD